MEQLRISEQPASIAVFELDLTHETLLTTPDVAALFGLPVEAPTQPLSVWEQTIFADDRHKLHAAIATAMNTGSLNAEFRVTARKGEMCWLAVRGETIPDESGTGRWLRGTCVDITDRKALEARLLAANETLEAHVKERTQALEASNAQLRESERRFRLLVESVTDYAIFMLDPDGVVVQWNPGAERLKGYSRDEIVGQHFSRFYLPEDRQAGMPRRLLGQALAAGKAEAEGWRVRKDGSRFWALVVIHAVHDENGQLVGFAKVTRDLTERRAAEEQLRQAQKMEALGQLTGGIAHDFNNVLMVISGNLQTLGRRLADHREQNLQRFIDSAMHGASRAAVLIQQLLAFSRRQALDPQPVSISALIPRMSELLRRTLPETIAIETLLAGGLWDTFADANQLENCLLNLAVNARDAMPDGGKLTIEAANVRLDEAYSAAARVRPGQYVGIFVTDTGTGMTDEVVARAFDPFFTTKEVGRGTGLGLSQVYGFVMQSEGHIKINSRLGSGTTIKIYLPRHITQAADNAPRQEPARIPLGNGETILLTEDEPAVRAFTADMLRELGYRVLDAPDGASALGLLDKNADVAVLFTDVGLPGGMNGRQLAEEALCRRPGLRVLFTSGYASEAIVHHGRLDPGVQLLAKPFTFAGLATKLQQVLALP